MKKTNRGTASRKVASGDAKAGKADEWADVVRAVKKAGRKLAAYPGVVMVRPGYRFKKGVPTREPAISVLVLEKLPDSELPAKSRLPAEIEGVPVDVRPASLAEQVEAWEAAGAGESAHEAGLAVARMAQTRGAVVPIPPHLGQGDDMLLRARREITQVIPYKAPGRPLPEVEEPMTIILNSGPDSGWRHLKAFFARTRKRLTATMYEFTARHIYDSLLAALPSPRTLDFVMDWEPEGDFSNDEIAEKLKEELGSRFSFAWAAVTRDNVTTKSWIDSSYHIKVAVRDGKELWLSSGNWKSSSQPEKDPSELTTDTQRRQLQSRSNRDWHVIVTSPTIAEVFEAYVRHDLTQAKAVQRTAAAAGLRRQHPDVWVPVEDMAALDVEVPRFFPAKKISGTIKVRVLLTPDNFIDHVLPLVEGAGERLYLENQALNGGGSGTLIGKLHRTIARKTREIDEVKIVLRSEYAMPEMFSALQAAGADMDKVRFLRGVHTKGIIVDNTAVVVGSHNLTGAGIAKNRDASLIIHDPRAINFYEQLFLYDWERAKPGHARPARTARLAVPGVPAPPGYVQMRWPNYVDT